MDVGNHPPPLDASFVDSLGQQLTRNHRLFSATLAVFVVLVALASFEVGQYVSGSHASWQAHSVSVLAATITTLIVGWSLNTRYVSLLHVSIDEIGFRSAAERALAADKSRLEQALSSLRETNELLERTFSSVKFLVAYMDTRFNFRWVNRAYADADGRSREFYPGRNYFDLFPSAENAAIFQRVVRSGEPYTAIERPFTHPDRPERATTYWDWSCHPIKDPSGAVTGLALCLIDRTAEFRAREESASAAETWLHTFDAIADLVSIMSADCRIIRANRAFCTAVATTADEVTGKYCYELVHGRRGAPPWCVMARAIASGAPASAEYFERHLNRWFSASAFPIKAAGTESTRIVHVLRDITATKAAEEQARHAQKMEAVGRLAGGIAHDFNNILSIIIGYCELMNEQPGGAVAPEIGEIHKAGLRAASLTRQLLAFSRRQVLAPEPLDVNEVVASIEKMLRRLIGEDIALETIRAARLPKVMLDRGQIDQVLLNLAVNARDAMPDGGTLTIETAAIDVDERYAREHDGIAGPHVMLRVRDTGIGMDEATRLRIFEPFFTTKAEGKGTGLGLSTVFGVVKQSRGSIRVDTRPGSGSTFSLYFPVAAGECAPAAGPVLEADARTGTETILVVEDEDQVRALTERILRNRGYRIHAARTAREALDRLNTLRRVDLLLTDVVMPEMSGWDLADRVRAACPGVKVLYMSGYDSTSGEGARDAGAQLIRKPITPASLTTKIREILDSRPVGA